VTVGYCTLGAAPGPGDFSDDADVEGAGGDEADCNYRIFEDAPVGVADDAGGFD
jgi:hypothetical protein